MKKYSALLLGSLLLCLPSHGSTSGSATQDSLFTRLTENVSYRMEAQLSGSKGKTPLWLNANKQGLSSLETANGYILGGVKRPLSTDDHRQWGVGYGVEVAVPYHYTSHVVVQQAYVEGRWKKATLTIGAKEQPMQLKDNQLSSGSQTLGINARPVPQVRIALPDYWTLPFGRGWLHIKGHIAYGKMTDQGWQHDFTQKQSKYADGVLYHSKAGYLKIGNEDVFCPWSVELGVEMAATFGGTSYMEGSNGGLVMVKNSTGLKSFWKAFLPGGGETVEEGTVYQNAEGNQLGSWLLRVNYDSDTWRFSVYADKFFEDHSSMFQLDYDGYGEGEKWNVKEKRQYFFYDLKDWLLGASYRSKFKRTVSGVTFEYLYTKYQSGPVYHDHTQGWKDHISGRDNFYNHYVYTGWQHWGQAIGNPLYTAPLYNSDGKIYFHNNRFTAIHLGVDGYLRDNLYYRVLTTYEEAFGTYEDPFVDKKHDFSFLIEGRYDFTQSTGFLQGCSVKAGYGMDFGSLLGGINYGAQLTFTKTGLLNF